MIIKFYSQQQKKKITKTEEKKQIFLKTNKNTLKQIQAINKKMSIMEEEYYILFIQCPNDKNLSEWCLQRTMANVIRFESKYHINKSDILFCTQYQSQKEWQVMLETFKNQEKYYKGRKKTYVQIQIRNLREYFQQLCQKNIQYPVDITAEEIHQLNEDIKLFKICASEYYLKKQNSNPYSHVNNYMSTLTSQRPQQNSQNSSTPLQENIVRNSQKNHISDFVQQDEQIYCLNTHIQQQDASNQVVHDQISLQQNNNFIRYQNEYQIQQINQSYYPPQPIQKANLINQQKDQDLYYVPNTKNCYPKYTQILLQRKQVLTYDDDKNTYTPYINSNENHNYSIKVQSQNDNINSTQQIQNRDQFNSHQIDIISNNQIQNWDKISEQNHEHQKYFSSYREQIKKSQLQQIQKNMIQQGISQGLNIQQEITQKNHQQINQMYEQQIQQELSFSRQQQQQQTNINSYSYENQYYDDKIDLNQGSYQQNQVIQNSQLKNKQQQQQQQQYSDEYDNYTNNQQQIPLENQQENNNSNGFYIKEKQQNQNQTSICDSQYDEMDQYNPQDTYNQIFNNNMNCSQDYYTEDMNQNYQNERYYNQQQKNSYLSNQHTSYKQQQLNNINVYNQHLKQKELKKYNNWIVPQNIQISSIDEEGEIQYTQDNTYTQVNSQNSKNIIYILSDNDIGQEDNYYDFENIDDLNKQI